MMLYNKNIHLIISKYKIIKVFKIIKVLTLVKMIIKKFNICTLLKVAINNKHQKINNIKIKINYKTLKIMGKINNKKNYKTIKIVIKMKMIILKLKIILIMNKSIKMVFNKIT